MSLALCAPALALQLGPGLAPGAAQLKRGVSSRPDAPRTCSSHPLVTLSAQARGREEPKSCPGLSYPPSPALAWAWPGQVLSPEKAEP